MTFSTDTFRYLTARQMPEGLTFDSQQQWLMNFIDSLERTVITQAAVRRAAEKETDKHAENVKQLLLACKVGLSSLRHVGIVGRSPETDVMEEAIRKVEQ